MTWRAERSSRWLRPGSVGLRGRSYVTLSHPTRAGQVHALGHVGVDVSDVRPPAPALLEEARG
eukprot:1420209-Prymnesium_polylepis.1